MYPQLVYISKPGERYTMYPVMIRGYTQAISVDAFNRRILNAAYKACHSFAGHDAYYAMPTYERAFEVNSQIMMEKRMAKERGLPLAHLYDVQEKEYELVDFYKEIQYDPKTGKIAGRTLRQHIKHYMKGKS